MRDPLNVELDHLREVARKADALVQIMDHIEASDSFKGIWGFLFSHGYSYQGENWAQQLNDLREALRGGK